jgi:RNA polymerase sigma-70 factor (ECF subfamily)
MRNTRVSQDLVPELVLLERARSRDADAFAELVGRYQDSLENVIFGYVRDRDRARDLVQEAVFRAFQNLDRYSSAHRFSTWFFRIGINLAISHHRKARREQGGLETSTVPDRGPESSALDRLVRREDVERLGRALAELPPRYQEVLRMRYQEGRDCGEIARRLRTSANAVSIVIFRAKERLREALEDR